MSLSNAPRPFMGWEGGFCEERTEGGCEVGGGGCLEPCEGVLVVLLVLCGA